jgi:hypothetical protein
LKRKIAFVLLFASIHRPSLNQESIFCFVNAKFIFSSISLINLIKLFRELNSVDNIGKSKKLDEGWELVAEEKDYQVLRRIHSGSIYEYRCSGTYYDITARGFIEAQVRQFLILL